LDTGRPLLYPNISAAFEVWGCLLAPGQSFRSYVGTLTASHVSNAYPNLKTASGCEQLRCLPVKLRISRPDAIVEHFISNLEAESVRWPRAGVEYAARRIKVLSQARSRLLTVRPGRARRGDGGNRLLAHFKTLVTETQDHLMSREWSLITPAAPVQIYLCDPGVSLPSPPGPDDPAPLVSWFLGALGRLDLHQQGASCPVLPGGFDLGDPANLSLAQRRSANEGTPASPSTQPTASSQSAIPDFNVRAVDEASPTDQPEANIPPIVLPDPLGAIRASGPDRTRRSVRVDAPMGGSWCRPAHPTRWTRRR